MGDAGTASIAALHHALGCVTGGQIVFRRRLIGMVEQPNPERGFDHAADGKRQQSERNEVTFHEVN